MPLLEPLRSRDLTGFTPFVAGWGSTGFQSPQSTVLREAQVPVVPTADCARNYKTYFPNQVFDNRVICAGFGGRDTCQGKKKTKESLLVFEIFLITKPKNRFSGDSGGPLMLPQVHFIDFF